MRMRRCDRLSRSAICFGAALSVALWSLLVDPVVNVVGSPDLALREVSYGLREVSAAGDLVDALPANFAQAEADLVGADETDPGCGHAPN